MYTYSDYEITKQTIKLKRNRNKRSRLGQYVRMKTQLLVFELLNLSSYSKKLQCGFKNKFKILMHLISISKC